MHGNGVALYPLLRSRHSAWKIFRSFYFERINSSYYQKRNMANVMNTKGMPTTTTNTDAQKDTIAHVRPKDRTRRESNMFPGRLPVLGNSVAVLGMK